MVMLTLLAKAAHDDTTALVVGTGAERSIQYNIIQYKIICYIKLDYSIV